MLLCLGLLILNITLWSTKTTLVHSSDKPPASASTNAYASSWSASGAVDARFTGEAELFAIGKKWEGTGRAKAGLGKWYQRTNPSHVDEGPIFVKIKLRKRLAGNVVLYENYAMDRDRSKYAWGFLFDKFASASGKWEGSTLNRAFDSWLLNPNGYY